MSEILDSVNRDMLVMKLINIGVKAKYGVLSVGPTEEETTCSCVVKSEQVAIDWIAEESKRNGLTVVIVEFSEYVYDYSPSFKLRYHWVKE